MVAEEELVDDDEYDGEFFVRRKTAQNISSQLLTSILLRNYGRH